MAFQVFDNDPIAGSIRWTGVHIVFQGTDYTINDGNTAFQFVWWDKSLSTTAFQTGDTLPTLLDEDVLVFFNKNGTHATIPFATTVDGALLVSESIIADKIAANAITAVKIAAGAITAAKIAANAVGAVAIAANVIDSNHLRTDVAVITVAAQIANALITNAHISDLSADKITAGVIDVLVTLGVGNIELDGTANTRIKIKDNQGTPATRAIIGKTGAGATDWGIQIFDQNGNVIVDINGLGATVVGTTQLADLAVTTAKIDTAAITTAKINTAAITTALIADLAVDTAKINNLAVTTLKVADSNITTPKIADSNVTTSKVAANAITQSGSSVNNAESILTDGTDDQSVAITTQGGPVDIRAGVTMNNYQTGNRRLGIDLKRGTTLLTSRSATNGPTGGIAQHTAIELNYIDTPGAGTYTYKFTVRNLTDPAVNFKVLDRSLSLAELKR